MKHKDEIENELIMKYKPSIVGFTETHVTKEIEEHELHINGYVCVRGDSESRRTGGVLLYIEERVRFDKIAIERRDGNWWTIIVKIKDRDYIGMIMIVYHSPNSKDGNFINFLEEICINVMQNDNVIIMGDFNIDMTVNNYMKNRLVTVMNSLGLRQLVKEATRIVKNSETLIDLVFANVEMEVDVWHEPKITDHSAIVLYWNLIESVDENKVITYRDYKRMDREKFKEMVRNGLDTIEGDSVNTLANLTVKEIIRCLDITAPLRTMVLGQKSQGKRWFCEEIQVTIKHRNEAYKRARISKTEEDWEIFRQWRNKTVDRCRRAKRGYLEEKLDKNKKDPKNMWRVLKEMMKGKRSDKEYKEIQFENRIIYKVEEMANIFNCYFVDSIRMLSNEDQVENKIKSRQYIDSIWEVFEQIEKEQLYRIIRNLENKAGTEEGINVEIMKCVVEVAAEKICYVLNTSLESGMFPNEWKEAIVVPIPKVRGTKKIEEFRPINKLPIYEKVLEIIVQKQLVEYLEKNELLTECQSGFRVKHSCETALQWVLSEWKKTIGEGKIIGVVFLDLKRAFEVVDRKILIKKLQWYGINGAVLNWFKSYLENRSQRVKFNGILSAAINVDLGVPQGSVLGPLLFLIYINDIVEVVGDNCEIRLFADDAIIYTTGYSCVEINNKLHKQMEKIDEWVKRNRLSVNVEKTKVMLIRGVRKKVNEENIKIKLRSKELEVVTEIKYLGIIIDKNLNFSKHVDYIGRKVGAKLGVMRRISGDISAYMRCIVYKTIIAPLFDYCGSIMVGISKTNVQHLQRLQNQAMRIILRCNRRAKIVDMLEALCFMSVKERIEYNVCIIVYKIMKGLCPKYLRNKIEVVQYEGGVGTRQVGNVYIDRCKTGEEQKMLLYEGLKMYNALPIEIKREEKIQSYRKKLTRYIITKGREANV